MTLHNLNPLIENLSLPPIPLVKSWLNSYSGAHGPVIDLSQAVPNYPPHQRLRDELSALAGDIEIYGYGPIEGEDDLRTAYAADLSARYSADISMGQTLVTSGCNQAFITAMITVAKAGDEVLLSNPFYFNHETSLDMLGIKATRFDLSADNGFVPDPAVIEAAITPKTRAVALVSPNNPTGAVYPADVLADIFKLCQARGIWLILDETYRDFLEDGTSAPHSLLTLPDWDKTLIQLYSFSKSFCIPGLRLGAVTAGTAVIDGMAKVMDNVQICAPRPPQVAIARAMTALKNWQEGNRLEIQDRVATMKTVMEDAPGWDVMAIGAYFCYVRHPFQDLNSVAVAERLAKECGLLTIPGDFFGAGQQSYLRFAFANETSETISQIANRLKLLAI
ncbi:MAG: aminotransferase [Sneathiella sp.]|nr:aminotransferase [Sneathiella sp.]